MYNQKYFEHNRPQQDWTGAPDLFTDVCDDEIKSNLEALQGASAAEAEAAAAK